MASGRSASITRASSAIFGKSLLCQGDAMWMTELTRSTAIPESRIGNQSWESDVITTSSDRIGARLGAGAAVPPGDAEQECADHQIRTDAGRRRVEAPGGLERDE